MLSLHMQKYKNAVMISVMNEYSFLRFEIFGYYLRTKKHETLNMRNDKRDHNTEKVNK